MPPNKTSRRELTPEQQRIIALEKENKELKMANEILKKVREFNPDKPNIVWVSDITYIKTGEGWLYLCVIIDLYGHKVIARQTSCYIDRHLVCQALKQALFRRGFPKNILIHSDRGSQ